MPCILWPDRRRLREHIRRRCGYSISYRTASAIGVPAMRLLLPAAALIVGFVAAAAEEPIFEPEAKLKVEAAKGSAGEGPAWDPDLGILTSGSGGIHRLSRDGQSTIHREKA